MAIKIRFIFLDGGPCSFIAGYRRFGVLSSGYPKHWELLTKLHCRTDQKSTT